MVRKTITDEPLIVGFPVTFGRNARRPNARIVVKVYFSEDPTEQSWAREQWRINQALSTISNEMKGQHKFKLKKKLKEPKPATSYVSRIELQIKGKNHSLEKSLETMLKYYYSQAVLLEELSTAFDKALEVGGRMMALNIMTNEAVCIPKAIRTKAATMYGLCPLQYVLLF